MARAGRGRVPLRLLIGVAALAFVAWVVHLATTLVRSGREATLHLQRADAVAVAEDDILQLLQIPVDSAGFDAAVSQVMADLGRLRSSAPDDPELSEVVRRVQGDLEEARRRRAPPVGGDTVPLLRASGRLHQYARSLLEEERRIGEQTRRAAWQRIAMTVVGGGLACWLAFTLERVARQRRRLSAQGRDLQLERERLGITLSSIRQAVVAADRRGRVTLFNRAAEELIGCSEDDAKGRMVGALLPMEGGRGGGLFEAALSSAGPSVLGSAQMQTNRGRRLFSCSGGPLRQDGKVTGAVMVLADITEKAAQEAEQRRLAKLESVGVLAGGIAHEFNNLLTAILGNISMMDVSARDQELVAECEDAGLRAKQLTQQLLTFAKGGEPVKRSVEPTRVLKDAASLALGSSSIEVEWLLEPGLWDLDADPDQLVEAFRSVFGNARQAMPDGGLLRVEGSNRTIARGHEEEQLEPGHYVEIDVTDQGAGIDDEVGARMFDPYFTTRSGSTGLGLSTAYSIVRRHGGQLSWDPEVERGARFRFLLPAGTSKVVLEGGGGAEGEGEPSLGLRVLVMDDEELLRSVACRMLERLGCRVETAEEGKTAVALHAAALRRDPFDLVLLDLTVPEGMGGREAIHQIRAADREVHALVSSGYSEDPVMANFAEHGFDGAMAKPFRLEDLRRAIGVLEHSERGSGRSRERR